MAAGAGGPLPLKFPASPVSYAIVAGSSNTDYLWASPDGTAAGVAPLIPWEGYLSYNDGSELKNFMETALSQDGRPLTVIYEFNVKIKAAAPIAGDIICVIDTPTINGRTASNQVRINMNTTGIVGEYQGNSSPVHSEVDPFVDAPSFKFRINTTVAVVAEIDFSVSLNGTLGSNVSTTDFGVWNAFL